VLFKEKDFYYIQSPSRICMLLSLVSKLTF